MELQPQSIFKDTSTLSFDIWPIREIMVVMVIWPHSLNRDIPTHNYTSMSTQTFDVIDKHCFLTCFNHALWCNDIYLYNHMLSEPTSTTNQQTTSTRQQFYHHHVLRQLPRAHLHWLRRLTTTYYHQPLRQHCLHRHLINITTTPYLPVCQPPHTHSTGLHSTCFVLFLVDPLLSLHETTTSQRDTSTSALRSYLALLPKWAFFCRSVYQDIVLALSLCLHSDVEQCATTHSTNHLKIHLYI